MRKVYYYPYFTSEKSDSPCHSASKWSNRPKPKMPNSISCALKSLYYITYPNRQKDFKITGDSSNVLHTRAYVRQPIPFSEFIDASAKKLCFFLP